MGGLFVYSALTEVNLPGPQTYGRSSPTRSLINTHIRLSAEVNHWP